MNLKPVAALAIAASTVLGAAQQPAQIIELPALDPARIAFHVDDKPALVLGPARVPTGNFRVENDAVGFADGAVALATRWGYTSLNVVDAAGKVVRIGNFKPGVSDGSIQGICAAADDQLLVLHSRTQFTIFSRAGEARSSGTRPELATMLCPVTGQQAWIRMPVDSQTASADQAHTPIVKSRRSFVALRLLDLANASRVVTEHGKFEAADLYAIPIQGMPAINRPPAYAWRTRPFSRDLRAAAERGRIHAGDGSTWEIRAWDQSGRLVRVLRVAGLLERITPELRSAFIDEYYAGNQADYRARSSAENGFNDPATYPETMPAFADLQVDRSGRLWVKRYPKPLDTTQHWWVFSADAEYLGRVDLPSALIVDDIGHDFVAGSYMVRRAAKPESDAITDASEYEVRVYRFAR